ncbi:MAG: FAD-dependent oxidoreductase [Pseudomonadota bacterium]
MRKSRDFDVAVVGAGIFGLSCARAALRAGRSVCVIDAERPGAGASGGLVGALSPHLPLGWNAKKQLQFEALATAERFWSDVEDLSGQAAGYTRLGRYLPLGSEAERAKMAAQAEAACAHWRGAFHWEILLPDALPAWINPESCAFGAVRESLSARIEPRRAIAALAAALDAGGAEFRCPARAVAVEPGRVTLADGALNAEAIVLAAGTGGAALAPGTLGRGVKGQAALLEVAQSPNAMVYADGIYVVPHGDGLVAVGSTSERDFEDPVTTDAQLDDVLSRAARICPSLGVARVLERWAAVRPRGPKPDPIVGPLPGKPGVFVANGGFKTGFGFAPMVGEAVARMIDGAPHRLPERFLPETVLPVRA